MSLRTNCLLVLAAIPTIIYSGCGPKDGTDPVSAQWSVDGSTYKAANCTLTGNLLESDCDDNNKVWITMGSVPTADKNMKVVRYGKTPLAADELQIDIAHGVGTDYLSTGFDNKTAAVTVTNGKPRIDFTDITFAANGGNGPTGDSLMISGYLDGR